ncbi:MAG: homoserine kinase [Candidatus Bathyarchaeia archaeon]
MKRAAMAIRMLRLRSPATTANLASGFDVFGLALKEPYDLLEVSVSEGRGISIEVSGYPVPKDPDKNSGGYVALRMMDHYRIERAVKIRIFKGIKPGSGLGSSAASAAGVAYALNKLFNLGLSKTDLVEWASLGEVVAAGVPHADNVSSAILGGFTIIVSRKPLRVLSFKPPRDLGIVVAIPELEKGSTRLARSVLPKEVPLSDVSFNVGHAALLAAGMAMGDVSLVKMGMEDSIVEPARARAGIVKGYEAFKRLAKEFDAGIAISGAGPSMLGIVELARRAELSKAMKAIFEERNIPCQVLETEAGEGVQEA